jgi:Tfp pilus assembly protein PilN
MGLDLKKASVQLTRAGSLVGDAGKIVWRILSLNPADPILAYRKMLCVTLESHGASLVLGTRFLSRIRIKDHRKFPFEEDGYPPPEVLASSVAVYLTEQNSLKTEIVLSVPKPWAVIKTVEFPVSTLENLPVVVASELDRITPFSPEEVYYDFKIQSRNGEKVSLLVIAARADRIDPYLDAFREKGLRLAGLTVHLAGMETLWRYHAREPETVFLEIQGKGYEGALFQNRSIMAVLTGSFDQPEEKNRTEQLLVTLEKLLPNQSPSTLPCPVLFNLTDKDPGLKERLKLRLTQPVVFFDEMNLGLSVPGDPQNVSYPALGGLLAFLGKATKGLNLMTKGVRPRVRTPFWLTIPLLLGLLALTAFYWITPVKIETQRLALIDKQITQKKGEVKKVEALKKEIDAVAKERDIISDFKNSRQMAIGLLKELTLLIPKDAWLTRVRISENQVNIEGYAPSATLLVPKLEASPFFKKVEFASPTYRDPKLNQDRFQIKMEIEGL